MQADYEKLGLFYLGKGYDLAARKRTEKLFLYESQDLVTHAVCVGMTGSGKTGLCISLLEEAAIDGVPAIVIDPKGDLANLLLQFPDLKPSDFAAWVDPEEARRNGLSPADFAAKQADTWKSGLADWQQDGARIARLRDSAEFVVYTPGSSAGLPVSILRSFAAPPRAIVDDSEIFQERIASTTTSLLGLLGIDADPLQSREHILIANILAACWRDGRDLDLAGLIGAIQSPPVQRIGVFELESFFPAKERFALAMRLNNLLASPTFSQWLEGDGLDIGAALWTKEGKPKISIFSIAHLSDPERMFFVSLLLNQTLSWMRTQSGTSSLRAILYMDEIYGYFPPVANPPSKAPLLTLLKQARAFGLGIVLATQNPVDLDYKGLANCGTWFIGRLQTERDKARLLDGLEGASQAAGGSFDRAHMDQILAGLGKRVFLSNNVHAKGPEVFETRFALSYLRGPMTRTEIKTLMDPKKAALRAGTAAASSQPSAAYSIAPTSAMPAANAAAPSSAAPASSVRGSGPSAVAASGSARPVLPPDVPQYFVPSKGGARNAPWRPALLGTAKVYFSDPKLGVACELPCNLLADFGAPPAVVDWDKSTRVDFDETLLSPAAPDGATYAALPTEASKAKSYDVWKKALVDRVVRGEQLVLFRHSELLLVSNPGESEGDFRVRLGQKARERRDAAKEEVRRKYAAKHQQLDDRLRRTEAALDREKAQSRDTKIGAAVSFGAALLGAFMGKKTISATSMRSAGTAVRGVGKSFKESGDVARAEDTVESVQAQLRELEATIDGELKDLDARLDPVTARLEQVSVAPKKANVSVKFIGLAWMQ
jgi:hypothetical protein